MAHLEKRLLSAREASLKLGISIAGFRRKVIDGTAPNPVKIGHRSLWPESEIDELIDNLIKARDTA